MALSKLAVRRLTILADYMDALPRSAAKHFDMEYFAAHKGLDDHGLYGKILKAGDLATCGTVACAFGWACTIPSFKRAGLNLQLRGDFGAAYFGEYSAGQNLIAAEKFFDIKYRDANHLFGHWVPVRTPKQWAARCRKYLLRNSK